MKAPEEQKGQDLNGLSSIKYQDLKIPHNAPSAPPNNHRPPSTDPSPCGTSSASPCCVIRSSEFRLLVLRGRDHSRRLTLCRPSLPVRSNPPSFHSFNLLLSRNVRLHPFTSTLFRLTFRDGITKFQKVKFTFSDHS